MGNVDIAVKEAPKMTLKNIRDARQITLPAPLMYLLIEVERIHFLSLVL